MTTIGPEHSAPDDADAVRAGAQTAHRIDLAARLRQAAAAPARQATGAASRSSAGAPEFEAYLHAEFPEQAPQLLDPVGRGAPSSS